MTSDQFPNPSVVPVMVNNSGTPQLSWISGSYQVWFMSQSSVTSNFWKSPAMVGSPNGNLTGLMSGEVINGNVALFQLTKSGSLSYISYTSM